MLLQQSRGGARARGRHKEALAAAERGAAEDAGIAQLHKNIGDAHYRGGRFDEAYDAYQRAVKFNEALGPDVWLKLGNIRLKRNERDDADQVLGALRWSSTPRTRTARQNIEAARAAS